METQVTDPAFTYVNTSQQVTLLLCAVWASGQAITFLPRQMQLVLKGLKDFCYKENV